MILFYIIIVKSFQKNNYVIISLRFFIFLVLSSKKVAFGVRNYIIAHTGFIAQKRAAQNAFAPCTALLKHSIIYSISNILHHVKSSTALQILFDLQMSGRFESIGFTKPANDIFKLFSCFIQKRDVLRITNICRCTGCSFLCFQLPVHD